MSLLAVENNYLYLPQQSEEHFEAHNKNNLDFIELNSLPSCLICFPIEEQSSRQFQDFWNWFLNEHSAETYTAYTTYYFDQAYFEDNFEKKNNSINQLLYCTIFKQQPLNFEYLNHQIHLWIAAHQLAENPLKTEEKSYQTAPVFDSFTSELKHSTQTVTPEPMANDPMQANILAALQGIQTALEQKNNTSLPLFRSNTQDPIEWLDDFETATTANQYNNGYKFQIIERRIQDPREVVTEYAKAIRKLIKCVGSKKTWTEEQKIHSFTKRLRTNLFYALWPLLALKDNLIIDMTIELVQQIEDNQRMHLGSTLPVFAPASVMTSASQIAAASFAPQRSRYEPRFNQPQQPPYQRQQNRGSSVCYHCGLTEHFSRDCNNSFLPSPAPRNNDNQNNRTNNNNASNQRPNYANINFFGEDPLSASQLEENLFYAFNLTNNDYDINELAINTSESTRKKKKTKVDFVLDPNKASTSTANNNEPPKAKVFKNPSKLELPKIVQKSGPYSVVKDLMKTPAHIIFGQKDLCKSLIPKKKTPKTNKCSRQARLADNSNVTSLICKAQVAGYFIDLILDSGSSVSVIAKHFLEAIGRKIDEPFT
ncbi:hypothetical protein G9A89_006016 [Geosiphon pyriformis]|nr:hypothetical protein G9A89_006016 [Geosiphon pyriformis]